MDVCQYCNNELESFVACCPHCGRPSRFPNVIHANRDEELEALDKRYRKARKRAKSSGVNAILERLEREVESASQAVISRSGEEISRLASSDRELYASFYGLVGGGIRIPMSNKWDAIRLLVDDKLFPHYKKQLRFAALSLDGRGLVNYGDCTLVLRDGMIAHRVSVFEENSVLFMEKIDIGITKDLPGGYRAAWEKRGKLAVAKLAGRITRKTSQRDFPNLLLKNGTGTGDDDFIEVHIYGPISVRTMERVTIKAKKKKRRGYAVRVKALREKLANYGVACQEL